MNEIGTCNESMICLPSENDKYVRYDNKSAVAVCGVGVVLSVTSHCQTSLAVSFEPDPVNVVDCAAAVVDYCCRS